MFIGLRHGAGDPEAPHQLLARVSDALRGRAAAAGDRRGCHTRGSDWIASAGATTSPEAATSYIDFPYYLTQALWTDPITNKILLEAGYSRLSHDHAGGPGQLPPDGIFDIGVTEQSATATRRWAIPIPFRANYVYRALSQYADNWSNPNHWRASASYVTGSHNMKVGYQGSFLINETNRVRNDTLLAYRFNQGVPNQFSVAIPNWRTADRRRWRRSSCRTRGRAAG